MRGTLADDVRGTTGTRHRAAEGHTLVHTHTLEHELISGKAIDVLSYSPKKGAYLINKTIKSAVANAENNNGLSPDELVLKSVRVDEGMTFRRTMPRARGSANVIRKRTAHITVVVANSEA